MTKQYISILYVLIIGLTFNACDDYLDDVPKGSKIPESYTDYEAFIRNEYTNHTVNIEQALNVLNDKYVTTATLAYNRLTNANYLWDETADRIALNQSDEGCYYFGYSAISTFNLIIENALNTTEATLEQQQALWAQAKVLRAMSYFNLANYYADTYDAASASTKLSVPLITSADINAPSTQVTIQELYDFMITDIAEALPYLPEESATPLHPNLGTGYAIFARLYLQMSDYSKALEYADLALAENDALYDWIAFYYENQAILEDPESYVGLASPMGYYYAENYNFRHGAVARFTTENDISIERAAGFETGDARFLSRWKKRTVGAETFYKAMLSGMFNYGGLTTTEMYLIKAECLVRTGALTEGLNQLNAVRKTRIFPEQYQDVVAENEASALQAIFKTKSNELILTIVPFCDVRRRNAEGVYPVSFSKTYEGQALSLSSGSHLWTMPFPQGATDNPGNGSITQNVEK